MARFSIGDTIGIVTLINMLRVTDGQVIICNPGNYPEVAAALGTKSLQVDIITSAVCPVGELICALYVTTATVEDQLRRMGLQ